jgi:phosphonate transport system substrate-binding protein
MKNLFIVFISACLLVACGNNQSDLDSNGEPKELVIALVSPGGDSKSPVNKALTDFKAYLEIKLKKKVKFYITTDYTSVIEAIHSKKAHIAYLSPFSYVLAAQNKDIKPLVVVGQNQQPTMYYSVIFASRKSGITSMDQLKQQSKQLTLSFSDPASASGHLIPFAYLNSTGINPDSNFKQIVFGGSHISTVLSVTSNKVDIGCSTEPTFDVLLKRGTIKERDFTILWKSDPIVASPICIRNDLNSAFIEKIKQIYLNIHIDNPAVFKSYIGTFHKNPSELTYIPIDDSLYNGIRKIANSVKDVALLKNF